MVNDWNKLSQSNKKILSKSIFIVGSRDLDPSRIKSLVKMLSQKANVVFGAAKEKYIDGLTGTQFSTLSSQKITKVNKDINVLDYYQRDLKYILDEIDFSGVIFINGSWNRSIHLRGEFWKILNKKTSYKLVSPFNNEKEAIEYSKNFKEDTSIIGKSIKDDSDAMKYVAFMKSLSFDWTGQVGAVLVKGKKIISAKSNKVVPYLAHSLHYGSAREINFSPPGDQNHYDTNHAEVEIILDCLKNGISMKGTKLYLNVMPCPTCARMLSETGVSEVIYQLDHSEGYAFKLFEKSGIKTRRITD